MAEFDWVNPDYSLIFAQRAERLNKLRSNPEMMSGVMSYYRDNPWQLITDWGCTFDPRNAERGLPTVIPFILFPRQVEWCQWCVQKWKGQESAPTVKSRDMGLSWLSVGLAAALCVTHDGLAVGFGSRKEEYVDKIGSPKSLFWKARMFIQLLPPEFRGGFQQGVTDPHMRLKFPGTDSIITGESGDGIGRGDRASIYFVDESAFLERPQLTEASLSQTTNCRIDISTPNGLSNPFAEKVLSGRFDTFTFHWRDDPRKDAAWYESQKEKLDPVTVAQEIDIDFSASVDGVVIPSAWIQSAIDAHIKLGIEITGERTSALDVADLGKDTNAQSFRHGILLDDIDEWHGSTVEDIYGTTERAISNCDDRGIESFRFDSDGLGAGVRGDARAINEIRKASGLPEVKTEAYHGGSSVLNPDGWYIRPEGDTKGRTNKDFFENRKAQDWWGLRDRFKLTHEAVTMGREFNHSDIISINGAMKLLNRLSAELSRPTYKKSGTGKIVINKAPDGAASPNLADSVMMNYSPTDKRPAPNISVSFFK